MPKLTLETLGRLIANKRGERGIRVTAVEIEISAATLSRVQRGHMPDLETFRKICKWLEIDPGEILGIKRSQVGTPEITGHFRKDRTLKPQTAQALAQLILAAQRAMVISQK